MKLPGELNRSADQSGQRGNVPAGELSALLFGGRSMQNHANRRKKAMHYKVAQLRDDMIEDWLNERYEEGFELREIFFITPRGPNMYLVVVERRA